MPPPVAQRERLLALVGGVLARNIFDWGSKACVQLYQSGTILDMYRSSRDRIRRPWRVRPSPAVAPLAR